jgi:hypothetical protein
MTYTEKIVDLATGEETIRPYTAKEIAEVEKTIAANQTATVKSETKATEKAALLAKLGISNDEAKLLLS